MKRIKIILILVICFLFVACNKNGNIVTDDNQFDLSEMNDIIFDTSKVNANISYIEGNNISEANYEIYKDEILLKANYLSTLLPGNYEFNVYYIGGHEVISIEVLNKNNKYQIINGSFETGDLSGWKTENVYRNDDNQQSFLNENVVENSEDYDGDGNYVYGYFEQNDLNSQFRKVGKLISSEFVLGGKGVITFKLGGGSNPNLCYISIRDTGDNTEIARYANDDINFNEPQKLISYMCNLEDYIGKKLVLEVCDYGISDWDLLVLDSICTYYEDVPQGQYNKANDIKPQFDNNIPSNNLYNFDFSKGLDGWSEIKFNNKKVFWVDDNILKSNNEGDESKGLLRSSLFCLEGSGYVSFEIAAAQGENWENTTYISIKKYNTNEEIFRFSNNLHDGTTMKKYYCDLSQFIGSYLYIEIVDAASGSWDTIFVSNIKTYYKIIPEYNYSEMAINIK